MSPFINLIYYFNTSTTPRGKLAHETQLRPQRAKKTLFVQT